MNTPASPSTASAQDWSFHCTACGKCCNSPPQASLPELFHHARHFIGALGVRRITFDDADAAQGALAARLLFPATAGTGWIALFTHAIDYPARACPALEETGHCALHSDRKPLACSVVPLDALVCDAQQHTVLRARAAGGTEYLGADCLRPTHTAPADFVRWVQANGIVDGAARTAVQAQRDALAADKRWWGDAVFAQLRAAGVENQLRADTLLSLPLAPVLQAVAGLSTTCHAMCIDYLDAQQALIATRIAAALTRRDPSERAFTARLRALCDINSRLLRALASRPTRSIRATADAWLLPH